ncbi:hypothetical protein BJ878DRAFT_427646 [Calycina marina]|uniref:DUF427 domain-containing protein n=1 Tax=Calycina marina TaxID=1763456 RepID=A0A9P7YYM0_9HELO|nr:hypothetical protein BJ878DRAFT_427646 [Calycina marina]
MIQGKSKATIGGRTIAETDQYEVVEGNVYAKRTVLRRRSSVDQSFLVKTNHNTHCPWKGDASYYTISIDKTEFKNAAWYYPTPMEKAEKIKDHVAFCK